MTVGSLFSGIGGFDLGFERAGFDVRWQVEINAYCRAVLRKHWPDVRRYADVRRVGAHNLAAVDVICGGFPCQDVSLIGAGAGLDGRQSGLWREFIRIVRELRPSYVVVENVAALLGRGISRVLGDLAACGYDAEWDCIPAYVVGAPQLRDRLWIVAYAGGERLERELEDRATALAAGRGGGSVAGLDSVRVLRELPLHDSYDARLGVLVRFGRRMVRRSVCGSGAWEVGPTIFRMAHGVPNRLDRFKGIGNAIVPQIAEWIAERIKVDAEGA